MSSIAPLILPVAFVFAGVIAYVAKKKGWKIVDYL